MSTLDYQAQLTQIYAKLASINSSLVKLALISAVNTIQVEIQADLNSIAERLTAITTDVETLQLTMADLITELRNH